jgi:hypothetical protein
VREGKGLLVHGSVLSIFVALQWGWGAIACCFWFLCACESMGLFRLSSLVFDIFVGPRNNGNFEESGVGGENKDHQCCHLCWNFNSWISFPHFFLSLDSQLQL